MNTKTDKEKAKAYDESLERAKEQLNGAKVFDYDNEQIAHDIRTTVYNIFPELKEPEDEKIRKEILDYIDKSTGCKRWIAWLEKQGEETNWKPSKEEMDVLYGLAYITDQYDEHKETVITRLYQDLKREFFKGSSYENMFPNTEDGVRRRSTIQILEYARSLDTYNQYGKADIDKNIAWLENQENKDSQVILSNISWHAGSEEPEEQCEILCEWESKDAVWHDVAFYHADTKTFWNGGEKIEAVVRWIYVNDLLEKQGEQEEPQVYETEDGETITYSETDGYKVVEPKFKVGDWITNGHATCQITFIDSRYWYSETCVLGNVIDIDKTFHLWTIQDAKDGDVLVTVDDELPFIYKGCLDTNHPNSPFAYCGIYAEGNFFSNWNEVNRRWTDVKVQPATKEQHNLLTSKMREAGYEWDAEKKELKKIGQNPTWSEEDEYTLGETIQHLEELIRIDKAKHCGCDVQYYQRDIDWLKSLKDRYIWKPSEE